jgi:hypothetical protein
MPAVGEGSRDVDLSDQISELLEDYRRARERQEQAQRDLAAANTAFVQTPDDTTRQVLDERTDAFTLAVRTVAETAVAVAEALDHWQRQQKHPSVGEPAADSMAWQK